MLMASVPQVNWMTLEMNVDRGAGGSIGCIQLFPARKARLKIHAYSRRRRAPRMALNKQIPQTETITTNSKPLLHPGSHPVEVIEAVVIVVSTQKVRDQLAGTRELINSNAGWNEQSVAYGTLSIGGSCGAKAITSLTESGSAPLCLSCKSIGISYGAHSKFAAAS